MNRFYEIQVVVLEGRLRRPLRRISELAQAAVWQDEFLRMNAEDLTWFEVQLAIG